MRFGWDLHIIISRSMEKTLKKSGVKVKKGKKENSLLVQRGWKFWTNQPVSKLLWLFCSESIPLHQRYTGLGYWFPFQRNTNTWNIKFLLPKSTSSLFIYMYKENTHTSQTYTERLYSRLANTRLQRQDLCTFRKPSWDLIWCLLCLSCFQRDSTRPPGRRPILFLPFTSL